MKILQIALITKKGNVFNVKMQIDEIVFESKEEVRQKLLSVFANRKDAIVDVVIHSIQDELEHSNYSNEQLKAELKRRVNIARMKAIREKPKYYYWEGTVVEILRLYNRFAKWKFKIDSEELAANENFSYLNKWHGFEMISGAFNMTTAPKVGDRVKLRYRVVKSHFLSYRDSKIVSVIERADLSNKITFIIGKTTIEDEIAKLKNLMAELKQEYIQDNTPYPVGTKVIATEIIEKDSSVIGWISSYEVICNSIYAKINKVNKDGSLSKVLNKRINVEEYNFEFINED